MCILNIRYNQLILQIKSSKQSRIVPPRIRPKSTVACGASPQRSNDTKKSKDKPIIKKSETHSKLTNQSQNSNNSNPKEIVNRKPPNGISSPKTYKIKTIDSTKTSSNSKAHRIPPAHNNGELSKPPPIPPRPKKKTQLFSRCIYERDLASLDYVNEAQLRMSPEVREDLKANCKNLGRNCSKIENERKLRSNFSSPIDEYYIEEDVDEKTGRHVNEFEDYFDQEFISELENYQLPKSSVNMLVLQHFK